MANEGRLAPPSLSVTTRNLQQGEGPLTGDSRLSDGNTLAIPTSPSGSLGGDTIFRPRSNSDISHVETLQGRSRSGSTAQSVVSVKGAREVLKYDDVPLSAALAPDQRNVKDFEVEDNPFAFSPGQLNKLLNPKSLSAFTALGGVSGLQRGLRTDIKAGLSVDETKLEGTVSFEQATTGRDFLSPVGRQIIDEHNPGCMFEDRIRVFDRNKLPERKTVGFWALFWAAYNDKIIILLTIAAIVSLALGIYETLSGGSSANWVEGVAICVAILIVTLVTAANDWQKERQFVTLNKRKEDREVKAVRSGRSIVVSIHDITVGDILHLDAGDAVPADGILISGYGVVCDESSATGESDQLKKTTGHDVWRHIQNGTATKKLDPFVISGSKVLEGHGTFLVTSVGPNSSFGKIMVSLQSPNDPTPLQVKLMKLADYIGALGTAAAVILFVILLIRFLVNLPQNTHNPALKGKEFFEILIVAITVIVVAIPEGLPLAVTLALAFATTKMIKENNLVRILRACETMGNATVICSDKTGTLTQNKMIVVAGVLGADVHFANNGASGVFIDPSDAIPQGACGTREVLSRLGQPVKDLLLRGVALNSTAFQGEDHGAVVFIGDKTESALLSLLQTYLGLDLAAERSVAQYVQRIPFDSTRKCSGTVIRLFDGRHRLFVKGASEVMLKKATSVVTTISDPTNLNVQPLSRELKDSLYAAIDFFASRSLRTIGLLYRDFQSWPPAGAAVLQDDDTTEVDFNDIFHDMTWISVVGIQDPLRPEVTDAIKTCGTAGVKVKMVTGDNLKTATAIAVECGIKTEDGLAMEGPTFRTLSNEDMDRIIPRLQVLARSSSDDKRLLVERLKFLGETVAVTGDGTNDGPALKTADIGFSMGITGTEVAKEASSIILLDDNFKSIVTAISWGRAVNDAVAKFLQFQVTVNITAVCLTFVSAVSNGDNKSVLTAVQLLWVNLIMDTFAALALATDGPSQGMLKRKPTPKAASLFTTTMWKMIIGQTIYQLLVTFVLYFVGAKILHYDVKNDPELSKQMDTIVFNTFVWMQIFNELNSRRLDNKLNIFEGTLKNPWFLGINAIMVCGQVLIIFIGGEAFQATRITGPQWAICIVCSVVCIPWAALLRCFPDRWMDVLIKGFRALMGLVWNPLAATFLYMSMPLKWVRDRVRRRFLSDKAQDDNDAPTGPSDQLPSQQLPLSYNASSGPHPPPPQVTINPPSMHSGSAQGSSPEISQEPSVPLFTITSPSTVDLTHSEPSSSH